MIFPSSAFRAAHLEEETSGTLWHRLYISCPRSVKSDRTDQTPVLSSSSPSPPPRYAADIFETFINPHFSQDLLMVTFVLSICRLISIYYISISWRGWVLQARSGMRPWKIRISQEEREEKEKKKIFPTFPRTKSNIVTNMLGLLARRGVVPSGILQLLVYCVKETKTRRDGSAIHAHLSKVVGSMCGLPPALMV